MIELRVCESDEELEAWRQVRMEVVPGERTQSVQEMRERGTPERLLLLAVDGDEVLGAGIGDRSDTAGGGFVMPRVRPDHRRRGAGTLLLGALAEHCAGLGVEKLVSSVDDEGGLAFAVGQGFSEVDREVEQVRVVGTEPLPEPLPGVEVVEGAERPGLWADAFDTFGREVMADFALHTPLDIDRDTWVRSWGGDPMFLALHDGEVVGCAGLQLDEDQPERAEHAITGVRRDWRGRGVARHLKLRTLHWASGHGLRELTTWTQAGNEPMLRLNTALGYEIRSIGITVAKPL